MDIPLKITDYKMPKIVSFFFYFFIDYYRIKFSEQSSSYVNYTPIPPPQLSYTSTGILYTYPYGKTGSMLLL